MAPQDRVLQFLWQCSTAILTTTTTDGNAPPVHPLHVQLLQPAQPQLAQRGDPIRRVRKRVGARADEALRRDLETVRVVEDNRAVSRQDDRAIGVLNVYTNRSHRFNNDERRIFSTLANLCAVAVGTETDGSIVSPSTVCGIVGIKPTVGLVSRSGIIPISKSQDTAGPMARSVKDAAIMLSAIAGIDPDDPPSLPARESLPSDYRKFLDKNGLRGARIGVARQFFNTRPQPREVLRAAIDKLREAGTELVDPIEIPSINLLGGSEQLVLMYEFKDGLNRYLDSLGAHAPIRTLADLIEFNDRHAEAELRYFGQETLIQSQKKGPLTEQAYLDALKRCRDLARTQGIDAVMDAHHLDAIVAPTGGPASATDLVYGDRDIGGSSTLAAVAGYPSITVAAGNVIGLPLGLSFFGRAYSEPTLLKLAYAFEQATTARIAPRFLASIG